MPVPSHQVPPRTLPAWHVRGALAANHGVQVLPPSPLDSDKCGLVSGPRGWCLPHHRPSELETSPARSFFRLHLSELFVVCLVFVSAVAPLFVPLCPCTNVSSVSSVPTKHEASIVLCALRALAVPPILRAFLHAYNLCCILFSTTHSMAQARWPVCSCRRVAHKTSRKF